MATKKSKRSTSAKKSAKSESTKATTSAQEVKETKEDAKVKAADTKAETAAPVDEVVEVVEIEAPVKETKAKLTISDKLAALNPAALIAELLGTFVLTAAFINFIGNENYGLVAFGMVVMALTVAFIGISGAHLNPAITLAQWINRKINGVKAASFIVAQVLGAILAFFVLTGINNAGFDYTAAIKKGVTKAGITESAVEQAGGWDKWFQSYGGKDSVANQLGITKEAPKLHQYEKLTEGKEWVALLSEILGSVIMGLGAGYAFTKRKDSKVAAGIAMGVSVLAGLAIAGSTAILNPAVASTMGVFSISSAQAFLWPVLVYVLGAIVGTTAGFAIYKLLVKNDAVNEAAIEG